MHIKKAGHLLYAYGCQLDSFHRHRHTNTTLPCRQSVYCKTQHQFSAFSLARLPLTSQSELLTSPLVHKKKKRQRSIKIEKNAFHCVRWKHTQPLVNFLSFWWTTLTFMTRQEPSSNSYFIRNPDMLSKAQIHLGICSRIAFSDWCSSGVRSKNSKNFQLAFSASMNFSSSELKEVELWC